MTRVIVIFIDDASEMQVDFSFDCHVKPPHQRQVLPSYLKLTSGSQTSYSIILFSTKGPRTYIQVITVSFVSSISHSLHHTPVPVRRIPLRLSWFERFDLIPRQQSTKSHITNIKRHTLCLSALRFNQTVFYSHDSHQSPLGCVICPLPSM